MQKKNSRVEERRKKIPKEIDLFVRDSFDIVDRIHQILTSQGKEQKDLAQALGKKESEISKWMTGTHNFTIKTLAKISAVLGEPVIPAFFFCTCNKIRIFIKNTIFPTGERLR